MVFSSHTQKKNLGEVVSLNPLKYPNYLKLIQLYEWFLQATGMTDIFSVRRVFASK